MVAINQNQTPVRRKIVFVGDGGVGKTNLMLKMKLGERDYISW